jgi:hypothetical protein
MDLQGTRRAVLLAVERIGSDDWLACLDGNAKRRGFSLNAKGFSIEQCSWLPNKDFLRILCQGARVCAYSARVKVPECIQGSEDSCAQVKEIITRQMQKIKFYIYC